MESNRIYHGDTLKLLPKAESNHYHLVIADPPYGMNKDFGNDSDQLGLEEAIEFTTLWVRECKRVLHPQGTMLIYGMSSLNWYIWEVLIRECGAEQSQIRELIWYYTNKQVPLLNFYQPSHENIIVYFKDPKRHFFNKEEVRQPYKTDYYKFNGRVRPDTKGRFGNRQTTYNANKDGASPRDVLEVGALSGAAGKERVVGPGGIKHPTQKPVKLTRWLIRGSSNKGHRILVPFSGSGTECLVANQEGREFLGFELNAAYVEMTAMRFRDSGINAEFRQIEGQGVLYVQ